MYALELIIFFVFTFVNWQCYKDIIDLEAYNMKLKPMIYSFDVFYIPCILFILTKLYYNGYLTFMTSVCKSLLLLSSTCQSYGVWHCQSDANRCSSTCTVLDGKTVKTFDGRMYQIESPSCAKFTWVEVYSNIALVNCL